LASEKKCHCLEVGALADVVRPREAEHVEEARDENVEAEAGEPIGVDLVVGGDAMGVVHHHDPRPRTRRLRMRHVAGIPSRSCVTMWATILIAIAP
jgi:hypothetical protein